MDAPPAIQSPPAIVSAAPDCLCKPDCKCEPCKCATAKTTGATVFKTSDGWKVTLATGRVHYFLGNSWTEKGMIAFAETYNAAPMPAFVPGPCPGGICPIR